MKETKDRTLTLVAFGAHPDPFDMPYQAGGTLAKYIKRGHRVIMVSAAYEEEWQKEIAAIAKHLGAEHRFLDFQEGSLFDDPSHTHRIKGVAHLDSIEHLIEREETNLKFRGFQVERDYCEVFQRALNYRVTWAHDLLPMATLPPLEE